MLKQCVGIARDHSVSMDGLTAPAKDDYNNLLQSIQSNAKKHKITTRINVVRFDSEVEWEIKNRAKVAPLESYVADGYSTAIRDAVMALIEKMSTVEAESYLILVVTDGIENSSRTSEVTLRNKIKELQNKGNWTFTFRVPPGSRNRIINWGVPSENVLEWDTTEQGLAIASKTVVSSVDTFYQSRVAGVKRATKFFADGNLKVKDVKAVLQEADMKPLKVTKDCSIREFVEAKTKKPYEAGIAFYQLTKKETVQANKQIAVRDKVNLKVFSGAAARDLLNLPQGEIKVSPTDGGRYTIFIQSRSFNRKLMKGTEVLIQKGK